MLNAHIELWTQIGESCELGRGIINKASFKAFSINLCNIPLTKSGKVDVLSGPVWLMPS